MGHIDLASKHTPQDDRITVPEPWLPVAADLTHLANRMARRTDLSALAVPSTPVPGTPAFFMPARAELCVDTTICLPGVKPKDVNMTDPAFWHQHPAFVGAFIHECGHAAVSRYVGKDYQEAGGLPKQIDVAVLLDEARVERHMASMNPRYKSYLTASALQLILSDFTLPDSRYGAGGVAALILARHDAGLLTTKEVQPYREKVLDLLGKETLATLTMLWRRFWVQADHANAESLLKIAQEWLDALGEDATDPGNMIASQLHAQGDPAEPGKQGQGQGPSLSEVVERAAREQATKRDTEFVEKRAADKERQSKKEHEAKVRENEQKQDAHKDLFSHSGAGSGERAARWTGSRKPYPDEHRAMVRLSKLLERVDYTDKHVAKTARAVPPGRMRTRSAMAWQSAQDRNMPAADLGMFTARTRTHTDSPPLKIGYLMDVSGSMVHASQPMSVAQWMLAAAGQRIDAQVATAHFGVTSYGVARAGQAKPQVDLWQCLDGWERPYRAWLALDAELDLLTSTGPRLLVIASDARWSRRDERSYMEGAMLQARKAGLSVMWLDVTGKFRRHPWHYGEIVPIQGLSSAEVAELIGQRAVRLLSEARR